MITLPGYHGHFSRKNYNTTNLKRNRQESYTARMLGCGYKMLINRQIKKASFNVFVHAGIVN